MLTAKAYDVHIAQLMDQLRQLHAHLTAAGIAYRIVGGVAVFLHVCERDPLRARLTSDVDAAIDRSALPGVIEVAQKAGWVFRRVDGLDMLIDSQQPRVRSAIHLFFLNVEAAAASPAADTREGILIAPDRLAEIRASE